MDFERLNRVPELRQKQRSCVLHHNLNVVILLVVVMLTFFASVHLVGSRQLGKYWTVVPMLFVAAAGIYVVLREDRLYAERTGFVCPVCGKSLYFSSDAVQKSALITKGLCPRCKADVVGTLLGEEVHSEQ
jgi:hypothetical protein